MGQGGRIGETLRGLWQRLRCALIPILLAGPVAAVTVTVNDVAYEIVLAEDRQSFDDLRTRIEATPWWSTGTSTSGRTVATTFARAYSNAIDRSADPPIYFAYNFSANPEDPGYLTAVLTGRQIETPNYRFRQTDTESPIYDRFRFALLAETVPELDRAALAALLLGLAALRFGPIARRRRV